MEITSAALELKPWWVGRSKEAVKHLENLWLFKKTRGIPNVAFLFISLCSTRFSCPEYTVMENPRPSDEGQEFRSTPDLTPLELVPSPFSVSHHPSETEVHVEAFRWRTSAFLWLLQLLFLVRNNKPHRWGDNSVDVDGCWPYKQFLYRPSFCTQLNENVQNTNRVNLLLN